jgi:hypothetical protein
VFEDEDEDDKESTEDDDSTSVGDQGEQLLHEVFDALTDDYQLYSIADPMTALRNSDAADELVEEGFLEEVTLGRGGKTYYKPTEKAKTLVDRDLSMDGDGEYGTEGIKHRIGCLATAEYYRKLGYNAQIYHSKKEDPEKYDVFAESTDDSPDDEDKYIEVETSPEKRGHILEDLKTLHYADGDAVWVVENFTEAEKLLQHFRDTLDNAPDTSVRNFEQASEQLGGQGADELKSLSAIISELSS